jgi:hypothetical protein
MHTQKPSMPITLRKQDTTIMIAVQGRSKPQIARPNPWDAKKEARLSSLDPPLPPKVYVPTPLGSGSNLSCSSLALFRLRAPS